MGHVIPSWEGNGTFFEQRKTLNAGKLGNMVLHLTCIVGKWAYPILKRSLNSSFKHDTPGRSDPALTGGRVWGNSVCKQQQTLVTRLAFGIPSFVKSLRIFTWHLTSFVSQFDIDFKKWSYLVQLVKKVTFN